MYSDAVLAEQNGYFIIHHRNLQPLTTGIFKFLNGLSPPIMNEVFQINPSVSYTQRDKNELYSENPKTVMYGTESISFLAPKIWSVVPQ